MTPKPRQQWHAETVLAITVRITKYQHSTLVRTTVLGHAAGPKYCRGKRYRNLAVSKDKKLQKR